MIINETAAFLRKLLICTSFRRRAHRWWRC